VVYLDTRYTIILVNRRFLAKILLGVLIKKTKAPINVRGISLVRHSTNKYVTIDVYIPSEREGKKVLSYLRREVYLVDYLKVKILIRIDVIGPKRIYLDLSNEKVIIKSYSGLTALIRILAKDNIIIRRTVRNKKRVVIPPNSITRVLV